MPTGRLVRLPFAACRFPLARIEFMRGSFKAVAVLMIDPFWFVKEKAIVVGFLMNPIKAIVIAIPADLRVIAK